MKLHYIIWAAAASLSLTSCFKEEPLNAECDIESATVHVTNPSDYFAQLNDSIIVPNGDFRSDEIVFHVKNKADLSQMAPTFKLTPGATISPESGSTHDFTNGAVLYTTTSEDGANHRVYKVEFRRDTIAVKDTIIIDKKDSTSYKAYAIEYDFENPTLISEKHGKVFYKYYDWAGNDAEYNKWATGNPGYAMSPLTTANKYEEYPTCYLEEGYEGHGVQLTTRETGPLAHSQNPPMPMAAGNLFLGTFNAANAFDDALSATQFGVKFSKQPVKFTGYYKYKPEPYELNERNVIDEGSIYAVFYKREFTTNEKGEQVEVFLNGRDVQTNPRIVALAKMPTVPPTDSWTPFDIEFKYTEPIDEQLLENNGYNLTIVFSSSINGAYFLGGIGSTLCIDKIRLICKDKVKDEDKATEEK